MQYTRRIQALQRLLPQSSLPALLLTNPLNIRYLTGATMSEGVLLVKPRSVLLFADARYAEAVKHAVSRSIRVCDPAELPRVLAGYERCGFEEAHVTAARLHGWKTRFKSTKFVHSNGLVEGLRRKKDADELRRIKRALTLTSTILRDVPSWLHPGITERALAWMIHQQAIERGAEGLAFETIVAFGPHTSVPHHHPTDRRLRARDIVQIDMGVRFDGYCSDRSEVFFVGRPTAEQRRVYDAVQNAKKAAIAAVRPGVTCAALDACARERLAEASLESFFAHALGHGVGLDIHEGVTLSGRSRDTLQQHEVVTIEPGVYLPGRFGVRLEDTIVVS